MNERWDELEDSVERRMRLLEALYDPPASAEGLRRATDVVLAEARRIRVRRKARFWARAAGAAAAAVALAAGLRAPAPPGGMDSRSTVHPAMELELWAIALEETSSLLGDAAGEREANGWSDVVEIERFFDNLGRSLSMGT